MMIRRALARIRHELTTLIIDTVMLAAFLASLSMIIPMIFIFAAQGVRLASGGDWRSVPLSEFLNMLGVETATLETSGTLAEIALGLQATVWLFLIAMAFFALGRLMYRAKLRERDRHRSLQQRALIGDIERELRQQQIETPAAAHATQDRN